MRAFDSLKLLYFDRDCLQTPCIELPISLRDIALKNHRRCRKPIAAATAQPAPERSASRATSQPVLACCRCRASERGRRCSAATTPRRALTRTSAALSTSTNRPTKMDARGITIVTLGVDDLARSLAFYRDGLKLPYSESKSNEHIAFFDLKGSTLALFNRQALAKDAGIDPCEDKNAAFSGVTLAHNVKSKGEVDALMALVVKIGGTVQKAAEDVFWGGYSGYFRDPDGHLWEVAWNPFMKLD